MTSPKTLIAGLVASGLSIGAAADSLFGVYAGIGTWQQTFSGDVTSGIAAVDIETDLGLDDVSNNVMYVAVEHGVPLVPNFRLQSVDLQIDGANTLTRTIDFNGTTFDVSDDVTTDVDLSNIEGLLYYQLLDNVVSLDLGVAFKMVDGSVFVATTTETSEAEFDGVLPLLYGRARADLPLTGLWVAGEIQGLGYDGNNLLETNLVVGWESPIGLGVEAGYRSFSLELESFDSIDSASIDIDGPFAALNYHF